MSALDFAQYLPRSNSNSSPPSSPPPAYPGLSSQSADCSSEMNDIISWAGAALDGPFSQEQYTNSLTKIREIANNYIDNIPSLDELEQRLERFRGGRRNRRTRKTKRNRRRKNRKTKAKRKFRR